MKKLDGLGISPAPWKHTPADEYTHAGIDDANGGGVGETYQVARKDYTAETANARLIAAAPELYKELYDACVAKCLRCAVGNMETETHFCGNACPTVKRWRSLLAKAAGEEEEL